MMFTNQNSPQNKNLDTLASSELEESNSLNFANKVPPARLKPSRLTKNTILQLQRTIGNKKVKGLLQSRASNRQISPKAPIARMLEPTVQRKLEGVDIENFRKWVVQKLRKLVEDLEPKISEIIETAPNLMKAQKAFEALKGLKGQDLASFEEWAEKELGTGYSAKIKADGIKQIATGAYSLEDAKRKFEASKKFLFVASTPNQPLISSSQLKSTLGLVEEPKNVFKKCTEMFEFASTEGSLDRSVVWTGGASSCIAVGVYKDNKAALTHGTQLELERSEYRASLIEKISSFTGDKARVYLVSETFGNGGTSYAKALREELEAKGHTVTEHHSKSLAINAKNGNFATSFDATGLPKKIGD